MLTKDATPLVSIFMPTHNRVGLLKRAVDSVLAQSYTNFEFIIVNDGSRDGTRAYLDELAESEPRIKPIHISEARGPSHARNCAIQQATGEFITDLDDDDEILPDRLRTFLGYWDREYAFITSSVYWDFGASRKLVGGNAIDLTIGDLLSHRYECIHFFTRRSYYLQAGLFDEAMQNSEDRDMGVRLALLGLPIKQVSEANYIIHTAHDSPRLSHDPRKAQGLMSFIAKHEHLMTPKNKKDLDVRLAIYESRLLSLSEMVSLISRDTAFIYLKFVADKIFPSGTQKLRNILRRFR